MTQTLHPDGRAGAARLFDRLTPQRMRMVAARLTLTLILVGIRGVGWSEVAEARAALPAPPAGWPTTLQLGMSSSPGDAAAMAATAPFGLRYQYLSGGVNTDDGWATWNPDGRFLSAYVQESASHQMTPVFVYYQLLQSAPATGDDEETQVYNNLQDPETMAAYYDDLKLAFQRAGESPSTRVVFNIEPDFWGYMQERATGDDAATVPAKVAASGVPELADLPDNVAGFGHAVVRLRDTYAPNVVLGYEVSTWGTGTDIIVSDSADDEVDAVAARSARFYASIGAPFDLAFHNPSDRDAAFKQARWGWGPRAWWDASDYARHARFLGQYVSLARQRVVLWQIPLGNTRMQAMNNTNGHYQDNQVEWLLDDPSREHLTAYANAGVVALLYGSGGSGATHAADTNKDGVTNPPPINGNTTPSYSADDDGGFFRRKAEEYYRAGPIALPPADPPGRQATLTSASGRPHGSTAPGGQAPPTIGVEAESVSPQSRHVADGWLRFSYARHGQ